jgi:putative transposase
MVRYRRNFLPGGTFFFTVTVADRKSSVLTEHIADLRAAISLTRRDHPFMIDAIVVLPDHLHTVMTLPRDDSDFPNRWYLIKRRFTTAALKAGAFIGRHRNGEYALWQRRFWEHTIRNEGDFVKGRDRSFWNEVEIRGEARPRILL